MASDEKEEEGGGGRGGGDQLTSGKHRKPPMETGFTGPPEQHSGKENCARGTKKRTYLRSIASVFWVLGRLWAFLFFWLHPEINARVVN